MKILCTGGSGFIGTYLIDSLLKNGSLCINLDTVNPKKTNHEHIWRNCNILNKHYLFEIFSEFKPTEVIHLAARTTTDGKSLDDYIDNIEGTANVLQAIKNTPSISRVIIVSSQHVRKPGSGFPQYDQDFNPHGLYGESKVITEQLTHQANLECIWTIIRPTTVWGPLHPSLPSGLWYFMKKGWYFHPKNDPVVRSYGYVKNVAWQIEKILLGAENDITKKVFYVGERPIYQIDWINAFSIALTGHEVPLIPRELLQLLAWGGDFFGLMNIKFPMNSPRFFNLTTTNPVPLDPVYDLFGTPPFTLDLGIKETKQWLDLKGGSN